MYLFVKLYTSIFNKSFCNFERIWLFSYLRNYTISFVMKRGFGVLGCNETLLGF